MSQLKSEINGNILRNCFHGKVLPYTLAFLPQAPDVLEIPSMEDPYHDALIGLRGHLGYGDHRHHQHSHSTDHVGFKVTAQSLVDAELSTHKHRWKGMRKIQKQMIEAIAEELIRAEKDIFNLFDLPSLGDVLDSFDPDWTMPSKVTPFKIKQNYKNRYREIIGDFQYQLIGDSKISVKSFNKQATPNDLPVMDYFLYNAFSTSIDEIMQDILANLPDEYDPSLISTSQIAAQLDNEYLNATVTNAGKRIKTKLAKDNFEHVYDALVDMATKGKDPWAVGRYLHKNYGGQLWYWNRITRSETVLAGSAAFQAQARASQVVYVMWSAALNACEICRALDGKMWELGHEPQPVSATHPHCMCILSGRYTASGEPIQNDWSQPSPYGGRGWTPERIERLNQSWRQ